MSQWSVSVPKSSCMKCHNPLFGKQIQLIPQRSLYFFSFFMKLLETGGVNAQGNWASTAHYVCAFFKFLGATEPTATPASCLHGHVVADLHNAHIIRDSNHTTFWCLKMQLYMQQLYIFENPSLNVGAPRALSFKVEFFLSSVFP